MSNRVPSASLQPSIDRRFPALFCYPLAQVRLEDVFRSTQQNMTETPGLNRLLALLLGMVAIVLLLLVLQQLRKRSAAAKPLNSRARLLKEVGRAVPLKGVEIKGLQRMADKQSCSDPLVLLLCPSLLAVGMEQASPAERKALARVVNLINEDTSLP